MKLYHVSLIAMVMSLTAFFVCCYIGGLHGAGVGSYNLIAFGLNFGLYTRNKSLGI